MIQDYDFAYAYINPLHVLLKPTKHPSDLQSCIVEVFENVKQALSN